MKLIIYYCLLLSIWANALNEKEVQRLLKAARIESHLLRTSNDAAKVKTIYQHALQLSEGKQLGEVYYDLSQFYINTTYPWSSLGINATHVFELLLKAAEQGHPHAQFQVGAAYATGIHLSLIPMRANSSIFLQYMSALSGTVEGHMAMGYRYLHGLGVQESCEKALIHYEYAANHVAAEIEERGYPTYIDHLRLSDIHKLSHKSSHDMDTEMIEFYGRLAEEGDLHAAMTSSAVYATGNHFIEQNIPLSKKYLNLAVLGDLPAAKAIAAYQMAQQCGKNKTAKLPLDPHIVYTMKKYLYDAHKRGEIVATIGLGYIHMRGLGVSRNITMAMDYYNKANGKHADAAWHIANIFMGRPHLDGPPQSEEEASSTVRLDVSAAAQYYMQAAHNGHPLALHRMGHLLARGLGVVRSCPAAVSHFKQLSEQGGVVKLLNKAHRLYESGNIAKSLLYFSQMASIGVESAQHNVAYILSRKYCPAMLKASSYLTQLKDPILTPYTTSFATTATSGGGNTATSVTTGSIKEETNGLSTSSELNEGSTSEEKMTQMTPTATSSMTNRTSTLTKREQCELRALYMYTVSARQGNAESYVRVGDTHYYGHAGMNSDKYEAAVYYQMAADLRHTQAIFNLGMMHEIGDGVVQDFHLAKRFYDQAAMYDGEAQLPRAVALAFLEGHKSLYTWLGTETTNEMIHVVIQALQSVITVIHDIRHYIEILTSGSSVGGRSGSHSFWSDEEEEDDDDDNQDKYNTSTKKDNHSSPSHSSLRYITLLLKSFIKQMTIHITPMIEGWNTVLYYIIHFEDIMVDVIANFLLSFDIHENVPNNRQHIFSTLANSELSTSPTSRNYQTNTYPQRVFFWTNQITYIKGPNNEKYINIYGYIFPLFLIELLVNTVLLLICIMAWISVNMYRLQRRQLRQRINNNNNNNNNVNQ